MKALALFVLMFCVTPAFAGISPPELACRNRPNENYFSCLYRSACQSPGPSEAQIYCESDSNTNYAECIANYRNSEPSNKFAYCCSSYNENFSDCASRVAAEN